MISKQTNYKKVFAKKAFGQNFLVDENIIKKIVESLELKPGEIVIEIGAGRGALTKELLETAHKVIAIEFDRDLIPQLKEQFCGQANFEPVEADALNINFAEMVHGESEIKLAANLPYNISTAILQRLMEQRDVFLRLVLMFQREVVERIVAPVGKKDRGFLTVLTELYFDVERLFDVPPVAFRPAPKVWSSVVRLKPKQVNIENESAFRDLISAGFAHKRKTISNNLKDRYPNISEALDLSGIDGNRRAETLTLEEWISLYGSIF